MALDPRITFEALERIGQQVMKLQSQAYTQGKLGYLDFDEFIEGRGTQVVGQDLFSKPRIKGTLSIDQVDQSISCPSGYELFRDFEIGSEVATVGFGIGNNITADVASKPSNDKIILDTSVLVNDPNVADAVVKTRATLDETDIVDLIVQIWAVEKEILDYMDAPSTADPTRTRIEVLAQLT